MASHKLKQLQTVRRIEREDAEPAFGGKLEALNPKSETSGGYGETFAKQSQFGRGLMGSTSFMERRYDDTARPETAENKANCSTQLITEGEPVPFGKLRAGSERSRRDARDTSGACAGNFAKQSQFAPGLMGATSLMERDYNDTAHPGAAGNKPNRPAQLINSRGQGLPQLAGTCLPKWHENKGCQSCSMFPNEKLNHYYKTG